MKKLLVLIMLGLLVVGGGIATAAEVSKGLTFQWEQAASDIPNLKEWGLYVMTSSGGAKSSPVVVPYTSGNGPFQAASSFTVTGNPGTIVRRYFVLDAVSKNDNRSGYSNEVFYDFQIPFSDVTKPMSLNVTASVSTP